MDLLNDTTMDTTLSDDDPLHFTADTLGNLTLLKQVIDKKTNATTDWWTIISIFLIVFSCLGLIIIICIMLKRPPTIHRHRYWRSADFHDDHDYNIEMLDFTSDPLTVQCEETGEENVLVEATRKTTITRQAVKYHGVLSPISEDAGEEQSYV